MTALGEIKVEQVDGCTALIVRMQRRWFPWDVWTIVENPKLDGSYDRADIDLTYGHRGFRAVRGLQRYYVNDITYWVRKLGSSHRESAARRRAQRALTKFVAWREKQRASAADLYEERS